MINKFSIKLNPYPKSLLILHGTRNEVNTYLKKISQHILDSRGCTIGLNKNKDNYAILLDSKLCTQATIAHEAIHISWYLNDDLGLNFNSNCDEQQTYLVAYIMNEINIKIKVKIK